MARPSRTRRIFKWTGVSLSSLILAIWVSSLWCWAIVTLSPRTSIALNRAGVQFVSANIELAKLSGYEELVSSSIHFEGMRRPEFKLPEYEKISLGRPSRNYFGTAALLPYWVLFLLTAIPTAWLWHRDRRRIRLGCCLRCGYDLTGNTSGVCPECGDKVHPPAVLADSKCGEKKAMANSE